MNPLWLIPFGSLAFLLGWVLCACFSISKEAAKQEEFEAFLTWCKEHPGIQRNVLEDIARTIRGEE